MSCAVKRIPAAASIALVFLLATAIDSFAETDPEKQAIIKNCERLYPDLEVLGREKFEQRYMYNKDLRNCLRMYNSPAWDTTDPDRSTRLVAAMDLPVAARPIRDQTVQSQTIPQWIRDDATRWYKGQEKDTTLSFGIRQLISSNMIQVHPHMSNIRSCQDVLCVSGGDFMLYSISQTGADTIIQKHTVQSRGSSFVIHVDQIARASTDRTYLDVNRDGMVEDPRLPCCSYYQFAHKIPLEIGSKVNSVRELTVVHELVYGIKNTQRTSLFAVDKTGYYHEVIDKKTGIVLFAKNQDNIRKVTTTVSLTDTNAFSDDLRIRHGDVIIPPWFRDTVKWWTQGQISDQEYLNTLAYLIKSNVLRP